MQSELAFCDLPDARRMAFRAAIEEAGGEVAGYRGPWVQVAIPNPAGPFFSAMDAVGLELVESSLCYFPLGTDAPAPELIHHKGYWLYGCFTPEF
jgi:hypothetical protein